MTKRALTATTLATVLFVNVLSANNYQNKAKTLINNTSLAAINLCNYVKANPFFQSLSLVPSWAHIE